MHRSAVQRTTHTIHRAHLVRIAVGMLWPLNLSRLTPCDSQVRPCAHTGSDWWLVRLVHRRVNVATKKRRGSGVSDVEAAPTTAEALIQLGSHKTANAKQAQTNFFRTSSTASWTLQGAPRYGAPRNVRGLGTRHRKPHGC